MKIRIRIQSRKRVKVLTAMNPVPLDIVVRDIIAQFVDKLEYVLNNVERVKEE